MPITLTKSKMNISVPAKEALRDERIGVHLKSLYPFVEIKTDGFEAAVARARQYAQLLGMQADQHILDVIECCFLFGNSIHQHKKFQFIVCNSMWHNEAKCQALRTYVIAPYLEERS